MPKFAKSTGYKMKGFSYPGESPLKIASVSGAQLLRSVATTYDKYINYGKLIADPIAKAVNRAATGAEDDIPNGKKDPKKNGDVPSEDLDDGSEKYSSLGKQTQEKLKGGFGSPSLRG